MSAETKYRSTHEWARKEDKFFVVGISQHAQESLGDIVFIELPEIGKAFKQGEAFGVVESVKAASDINMPLSGKIAAVNEALEADPALVNRDPLGEGWIIKVEAGNPSEWDGLLSKEAYDAEISKE